MKLTLIGGVCVGFEDREDRDDDDADGGDVLVVVGFFRGCDRFGLCFCLGSDASGWVSVSGGFREHVFVDDGVDDDAMVVGGLEGEPRALRAAHPETK
jgi:hypothetical protein